MISLIIIGWVVWNYCIMITMIIRTVNQISVGFGILLIDLYCGVFYYKICMFLSWIFIVIFLLFIYTSYKFRIYILFFSLYVRYINVALVFIKFLLTFICIRCQHTVIHTSIKFLSILQILLRDFLIVKILLRYFLIIFLVLLVP